MFSQLEDRGLDWTRIEIYQVDERVAPAGSEERNLTHLIESLSIGAQGSIRPMPVTEDDSRPPRSATRSCFRRPSTSPTWASAPTGTQPRSSQATRSLR